MDAAPIQPFEPALAKYTLNEEQEKKEIIRHYRALLKALRPKLKKGDKELLRTAFEMAANAHKTMRRKSGEPYILHPIAVAMICVEEIGLGVRSSICALLHDTVEDTDISLEDIEMEFGTEIAKIVDGLTKISGVMDTNTSQQAENFKKILLTLTDDPRVILIKLSDRLHNMRTLEHLPDEKRCRIALETREIFAPLANRLGIGRFKWELEDLAFKYLEPEGYRQMQELVAERRHQHEREPPLGVVGPPLAEDDLVGTGGDHQPPFRRRRTCPQPDEGEAGGQEGAGGDRGTEELAAGHGD